MAAMEEEMPVEKQKQRTKRRQKKRRRPKEDDATAVKRQRVRAVLRDEMAKIEGAAKKMVQPGNNVMATHLAAQDTLYSMIEQTREGELDARNMALLSELLCQKTERVVTQLGAINPAGINTGILETWTHDGDAHSINFGEIGSLFAGILADAPRLTVVLGPVGVAPAKKKKIRRSTEARQRMRELRQGAAARVARVADGEQTNMSTRDDNTLILKIRDLIREEEAANGPIGLYPLVVNPASFGQTVENLFFISFLIRHGWVGMRVENNIPVVFSRDQDADLDPDHHARKQAVLSIDHASFARIITDYNITDSFIPHRDPVVDLNFSLQQS